MPLSGFQSPFQLFKLPTTQPAFSNYAVAFVLCAAISVKAHKTRKHLLQIEFNIGSISYNEYAILGHGSDSISLRIVQGF